MEYSRDIERRRREGIDVLNNMNFLRKPCGDSHYPRRYYYGNYISIYVWAGQTAYYRKNIGRISFEEFLDQLLPEHQIEFLFHLDIFKN
jgi:hypothetical protein